MAQTVKEHIVPKPVPPLVLGCVLPSSSTTVSGALHGLPALFTALYLLCGSWVAKRRVLNSLGFGESSISHSG